MARTKATQPNLKIAQIEAALRQTGGMITAAAALLNVTHSCISQRIKRSKVLQKVQEEIVEAICDKAENVVHSKIAKEKDLKASMFYLRYKGQKRGYFTKQQIEGNITVTHDDWIKRLDEQERKRD